MAKISKTIKWIELEIENIKKYANKDQIKNLKVDRDAFDPELPLACIYGLMTGSCFSQESIDLHNKCVVATAPVQWGASFKWNLKDLVLKENKKYNKVGNFVDSYWFSALEVWLCLYPDNAQDIIDYLLEETDILKVETL